MTRIVSARIHPAIGIARVGNSPDDFFIGPEVPYPTDPPNGGYKDASGRLKRQAARFRVYGYDDDGNVVRELTADDADIKWSVHVANKKAAWYDFVVALDIPEAADVEAPRRNSWVASGDRGKLVIDPGPKSIGGRNRPAVSLDGGRFFDEEVNLGELRTDEHGRLVFLGGRGKSGTPFPGNSLTTFDNNNGWYDDTSDGPVHARVALEGKEIPVDPAWVVVAPPNYAPDIVSPQTMYDVIYDALYTAWFRYKPIPAPSFKKDILPLLLQFSSTQWVNYGFFVQFGWTGPNDFSRKDYIAKLGEPGSEFQELRTQIFHMFRDPSASAPNETQWPHLYGDAFGNYDDSAKVEFTVTSVIYGRLTRWMNGDFAADYDDDPLPPLEELGVEEQPDALDRAALHFCLGGPFHPGCEMTWPMRQVAMYRSPFRLRERRAGLAEPDYGEFMTPALALSDDGPLAQSGPGDVTRWMAVPWQSDTASCRSGYPTAILPADPYLPAFWPARVPNQVLLEEDYEIVMDENQPGDRRVAAFNMRQNWLRALDLNAPYLIQITKMIDGFGDLGVVERRPGPTGDARFPSVMYVETGVSADIPEEIAERSRTARGGEKASLEYLLARFGGRGRPS
jgi:hypothetical protein